MRVVLSLNHDCNLRCSYCYAGRKFARAMPLEVARAGIDLTFQRGRPQLGLFGGEPLLDMDLARQVVSYARQRERALDRQLRIHVVTNGTLLRDDVVDWLIEERIDLGVSLDGCHAAHDATRRFADGRSSWEQVTSNVAAAWARRGSPGRVIAVLAPANVAWMAESFDALLDLGARSISMNIHYGARWDDDARHVFDLGLKALGGRYVQAWREGRRFSLNLLDKKIETHLKGGYTSGQYCDFGCDEVAVAPSGRLYPCDRLIGEDDRDDLVIGDVFSGVDVARRDALIRDKNTVQPDCASCALQHRCMHWCGCVNHALTGSVGGVAGELCWFEQRRIEEADRCAAILFAERNPGFIDRFYGSTLRAARRSLPVLS